MTATAVDRDYTKLEGSPRALPVAASTTIYLGTAVAVTTSTGYATSLTDSALLEFMGVASEGVINTTAEGYGSAGDLNVRLATEGVFSFVSAGLAITDQGCDLYFADNQTVQKAPTTQYAGKLHRYTSATEALVDIGPALSVAPTTDDQDIEHVGVAAAKAVTINEMVCLDAGGYLVAADDATAMSFWGICLETVDNAAGADGDLTAPVARSGSFTLIGAGLAATDNGKEVWHSACGTTVTTTPGTILVGTLEYVTGATVAKVAIKPLAIVGQRIDRQRVVPFGRAAAAGNGLLALQDWECDRRYIILSAFADLDVAPGGADVLSLELSDGTTTYAAVGTGISAAGLHGENKVAQVLTTATMKANTDTDITITDSAALSAGLKGQLLIERL